MLDLFFYQYIIIVITFFFIVSMTYLFHFNYLFIFYLNYLKSVYGFIADFLKREHLSFDHSFDGNVSTHQSEFISIKHERGNEIKYTSKSKISARCPMLSSLFYNRSELTFHVTA